MGKFRERSRLQKHRYDPLSGQPGRETKSKKEPTGLKIIYEKLCSSQESDYLHALHSLGGLAADGLDTALPILDYAGKESRGALVCKLTTYILHHDQCVRLAAIGAMRNLSACGSEECVARLIECGVVPVLSQLLHSYLPVTAEQRATFLPSAAGTAVPVAVAERLAVLEQAAYVLYNLCELSDEVVQACTDTITVLLEYSDATTVPASLALATNSAILCLTENNPQACAAVEQRVGAMSNTVAAVAAEGVDTSPHTVSVDDAVSLQCGLTVAGIIINIGLCDLRTPVLQHTMTLITRALSVSAAQILNTRTSTDVETTPTTTSSTGASTNGTSTNGTSTNGTSTTDSEAVDELNHITLQTNLAKLDEGVASMAEDAAAADAGEEEELVLQLEDPSSARVSDNGALSTGLWEVLQHWLGAQQLALELLNNICCGDDDSDSFVENDNDDGKIAGDDDDEEEDMEKDGEEMEEWETVDNDAKDKEEVLQPLVVQLQLFDRVLQTLQPADPAVQDALRGSVHNRHLQILMSGVRLRSLSTMQALLEMLTMAQLGGPERLFCCWTDIGRLAFADAGQGSDGVLEAATGAMRAVVSKFTPSEAQYLSAISPEELQLLFSAGLTCCIPGVRSNLARLLGVLGCLLLSQGTAQDLLRDPAKAVLTEATEFLLKLAGTDPQLHVSAEALDVLIDLYSDDRTDSLAYECQLVARLRLVHTFFAARMKKEGATSRHRVLLVTVKENLPAFLKYKAARLLNFDPLKKHASKAAAGGKPKNKSTKNAEPLVRIAKCKKGKQK